MVVNRSISPSAARGAITGISTGPGEVLDEAAKRRAQYVNWRGAQSCSWANLRIDRPLACHAATRSLHNASFSSTLTPFKRLECGWHRAQIKGGAAGRLRLPSESEWEYAARAGSNSMFASGTDATAICRYANVWDKSGKVAFLRDLGWDRTGGDCDDLSEYTSVVGMYEGNAFDLHDMVGNVGEYVQDCQHRDYQGAPADGAAWVSQCDVTDGADMIITRGGSYGTRGDHLRFTMRGHSGAGNHSSMGLGIRIAQTVETEADLRVTPNPFEAELAKAQAAERMRRSKRTAIPAS